MDKQRAGNFVNFEVEKDSSVTATTCVIKRHRRIFKLSSSKKKKEKLIDRYLLTFCTVFFFFYNGYRKHCHRITRCQRGAPSSSGRKYRDSFSFCFLATATGSNFALSPSVTVAIKFSCKAESSLRCRKEAEQE